MYTDYNQKNPCFKVQEFRLQNSIWQLEFKNGQVIDYDEMDILIHNVLFQLIQLTHTKKNTHLILFNDQIPKEQLRILHLQSLIK